MARHGVALAAAARAMPSTVSTPRARLGIGPFPRASLAMAGEIDTWLAEMAALDAEDRLRARLASDRTRDADHGTTSCRSAPQRSRGSSSRSSTCRRPRVPPASRRPS